MVQGAQIICFSPKSTNLQMESNQILAPSLSPLPSPSLSPAPLLLLVPQCLNSHPCLSTELLFNTDNPYLTSSLKLSCTKGPFPTTFCSRKLFNSARHAAESQGNSSKWHWKPGTQGDLAPVQPQIIQFFSSHTRRAGHHDKAAEDSAHKWGLR